MDPIQAIITALVAGASAALQTGAAENDQIPMPAAALCKRS